MHHTTTNNHPGTRETVAAAFWLLAGIMVMIASGDALALLIAAVVIVTLVWGLIRQIEHRVRHHAKSAPVTYLRPALTSQRDLKKTAVHAKWRGSSAA